MRRLFALTGLALVLLCGMAQGRAEAADAEVRFVITNGGTDVGAKGEAHYFPAGNHDSGIDWARSGETVRLPEGSYDVHVTFSDGDARKEVWLDNQAFAGTVENTVEIALPITEVRYVITNGGSDVGGRGEVHYFPAGSHDSGITWARSGDKVRIPESSYDVHVTFADGDAHKEVWLNNQAFAGTVEKTVEVGVKIAQVRYVITNGGTDVGGRGQVHYFPAGRHDSGITWANSGGSVRIPEGSYDVQVTFSDGDAHREKWLSNQDFSGDVNRTVEIGLAIADVRYLITNGGADVGKRGQIHYFPAGRHDAGITWTESGGTVRLPEGSYDAQVTFVQDLARKEIWLSNQDYAGRIEQTIELGVALAEPMVTVTQLGTDLGNKATVTFVQQPGNHELGNIPSGQKTTVEAGSYDIRAAFAGSQAWLRGVAISGQPQLTIELQPPKPVAPVPDTFTLAAPAAAAEQINPQAGDFPYLPPLPGSVAKGGKADNAPVYVQLPDARQPELVANGSIVKSYQAPAGVTVAQLLALYHDALLKAGWSIVSEIRRVDAILTTHYGQSGRNIWAFIHADSGGYSITVADATMAEGKLAADLGSACHLALTGVLFDFNKSTLKPESDAVLQQVGAVMRSDAALRLEVQGHTDGVGSDAYNQPLSEARARSVVVWLTQHGVAPDRLSARGYGKTRPIATNGTDEGRARNRRVEIANPGCKAKG